MLRLLACGDRFVGVLPGFCGLNSFPWASVCSASIFAWVSSSTTTSPLASRSIVAQWCLLANAQPPDPAARLYTAPVQS